MKALITPDGCLWTEVHRQGTDGFFAVRLKRRN
jgi:16S rRNA C967 or C1407 C5-methylase (RsmB/RsmF family)